jgi:catechol-2,3-dioxygenase
MYYDQSYLTKEEQTIQRQNGVEIQSQLHHAQKCQWQAAAQETCFSDHVHLSAGNSQTPLK